MLRARPSYSQASMAWGPAAIRMTSRGTNASTYAPARSQAREDSLAVGQDCTTSAEMDTGGAYCVGTTTLALDGSLDWPDWQVDAEGAAVAFLAFDLELAAVALDNS